MNTDSVGRAKNGSRREFSPTKADQRRREILFKHRAKSAGTQRDLHQRPRLTLGARLRVQRFTLTHDLASQKSL
jgi:hypothetical protein